MIATVRGVAALAVIAIGLAIVLVVDLASTSRGPIDRALWRDFDARAIVSLAWTAPPAEVRHGIGDARQRWLVCSGPADLAACSDAEAATVDAAVSALRAGRWHRRDGAGVAGNRMRVLTVTAGQGAPRRFELGEPLAGTDQQWLVADGAALLVDGWVAHALFPAPLELVVHHPFDAVAQAPVRIAEPGTQLELAGRTRRAGAVWIDRALTAALDRALEDVTIAALPAGPIGIKDGVTVAVGSRSPVTLGEPADPVTCPPGMAVVTGATVHGCVTAASWQSVLAAARPLLRPTSQISDVHPAPFGPSSVTLLDGSRVVLGATPALVDAQGAEHPADRDRVAELAHVLTTPATPCLTPLDARGRRGTLVVTGPDDPVRLDVIAPDLLIRDDGTCLRAPRADLDLLARPGAAYADPTRWVEDPATISSLTIDGVTYVPGAAVGEWTRTPAGPIDPKRINAIATQLATVRAPAAPAPAQIAHRIAVTFTPPMGAPSTHHLEVGAGCAGVIDGAPAQLATALCAALVR